MYLYFSSYAPIPDRFCTPIRVHTRVSVSLCQNSLWPVPDEGGDLREEVGEHGEGPAHVEDDEAPSPVGDGVDVPVSDLRVSKKGSVCAWVSRGGVGRLVICSIRWLVVLYRVIGKRKRHFGKLDTG